MQTGSFGDIVFQVDDKEVFTIKDFTRRRSAQFAEHAVVDGLGRLQHLGTALAEVEFKIQLDHRFTDVQARLDAIDAVLEKGEHHALVISGRRLGKFVLVECSETSKRLAPGRVLFAEISLKLREYN